MTTTAPAVCDRPPTPAARPLTVALLAAADAADVLAATFRDAAADPTIDNGTHTAHLAAAVAHDTQAARLRAAA